VVRGVEQTLGGIGYSGIGYRTSGVRVVPLNGYEASADNAATGDYPLARFLYIAANQHPNNGWNPMEREFFRMVLSKEGQEVVNRDGYVTLSAAAAERFRTPVQPRLSNRSPGD
jgi:phosphate transport system substrate-binding protein